MNRGAIMPSAPPPRSHENDQRCPCGSTAFDVIYTATVYVRVDNGAVARVVLADESTGEPILTECAGCGSAEANGCEDARQLAETAPEWPAWDIGG